MCAQCCDEQFSDLYAVSVAFIKWVIRCRNNIKFCRELGRCVGHLPVFLFQVNSARQCLFQILQQRTVLQSEKLCRSPNFKSMVLFLPDGYERIERCVMKASVSLLSRVRSVRYLKSQASQGRGFGEGCQSVRILNSAGLRDFSRSGLGEFGGDF